MKALTFKIRLVEPLLTTQTHIGEANSSVASPFIPGSMIRGALVGRHLKGRKVDAEEETMQQLFLSGKVLHLNAYPAHPTDGSRSLPKPLSWFVSKREIHRPDATISDFAVQLEEDWKDPPKPPGCGDFYWRHTFGGDEDEEGQPIDVAELYTPVMQVAVHNFGKNRSRKGEKISEVFRYDAIAPGEVFVGVIASDDKSLLIRFIQPLLEKGDFFLGRSARGGYGKVEITEITMADPWWEVASGSPEEPLADCVRLTCLSDVIMRNTNDHILKKLEDIAEAKIKRAYWRPRLVGGYNRKWGLPLPQAWAIQAGSVFIFPGECRSRLEPYIESGMGERRIVGYGRVALSSHIRPTLLQQGVPEHVHRAGNSEKLSPEEAAVLKRMANRQLQVKLDHALVEQVADLAERFKDLPSPAQLSRACLAAKRAWHNDDLSELKRHFEKLSPTTLKEEWQNARVGNANLGEWILKQVGNKNDFRPIAELPVVGGVSADFSEIRDRTLARLIEGVLRHAFREAKRGKVRENHG